VLVVGPNGAGKTNLLEAVHVGSQGFSFRTRRDAGAVRFGAEAARVELAGTTAGPVAYTTAVTIAARGDKTVTVNGTALSGQEELRRSFPVLAFTPDRLAVVKGSPIVRRTYLDRSLGRLFPARASLPAEYARALAQRNAALRRVGMGLAGRDALEPWDAALLALATALDEARTDTTDRLAPLFAEQARRLDLAAGALAYRPNAATEETLAGRLDRDLERGLTGVGPHLADLELSAGGVDLRAFGSQGQQRLAVLALVLAEAHAIDATHDEPPLLLLDDVLSELDDRRRAALLDATEGWQVFVSATSERALPAGARGPEQILDVVPGEAKPR
jgi:DNA replication and repair protein RecF